VIVRLGLTAGLRNGLSRMSGNHHVRFLGEDAVERPHPYPTNDRTGVEKDGRFEDFTRMHKAESECPDRDDVDADADVFGIETADQELLAIKTIKARTECGCRSSGITKSAVWSGMTALRDERDPIAWNELWNGKSDGLFGHGGTSCILNGLALSQKPKRQAGQRR